MSLARGSENSIIKLLAGERNSVYDAALKSSKSKYLLSMVNFIGYMLDNMFSIQKQLYLLEKSNKNFSITRDTYRLFLKRHLTLY